MARFATRTLLAIALLAVAVQLVAFSGAAFTATSQNPGNAFTAASSFCTPGSQTVTATRDSYVDQTVLSANSNFGTGGSLLVRSVLLGNRRALVGFNLPTIPAHCSVTGSTLRLFATAAASGRTIEAARAAAPWGETTVTWNNQPATTGSAATSSAGTGWRSWAVTAQVQAMYAGANDGFVVRDASESAVVGAQQTYQSREATPDAQDPQLIVDWS